MIVMEGCVVGGGFWDIVAWLVAVKLVALIDMFLRSSLCSLALMWKEVCCAQSAFIVPSADIMIADRPILYG